MTAIGIPCTTETEWSFDSVYLLCNSCNFHSTPFFRICPLYIRFEASCFSEEVGEGREGGGTPAREGEGVARASVHSVPRPTLDAKKLQL